MVLEMEIENVLIKLIHSFNRPAACSVVSYVIGMRLELQLAQSCRFFGFNAEQPSHILNDVLCLWSSRKSSIISFLLQSLCLDKCCILKVNNSSRVSLMISGYCETKLA